METEQYFLRLALKDHLLQREGWGKNGLWFFPKETLKGQRTTKDKLDCLGTNRTVKTD